MPATTESGFFESPFSRTQTLLHNRSKASRSYLSRTTSQFLSHKGAPTSSRIGHRPSQTSGGAIHLSGPPESTNKGPSKRGMSFQYKRRSSRKSGTILRAVPPTTACATAPLFSPTERDMSPPNRETAADGHSPTPTLPHNNTARTRLRSSSASALLPIKAGMEMTSFSNNPSVKGTIGTYKHGRVQWEQKSATSPDCQSLRSSPSRVSRSIRNQRPQIQVVIPNEQRDRPLPTSPFFNSAGNSHIRSASAEIETMSAISPPSGSKVSRVRESIVSPLSAHQARSQPHFHPSITTQMSRPAIGSPELSNTAGNSSDDSVGDDASSTHSNQSSITSAEAGSPPLQQKPMRPHERIAGATRSVSSPVVAGVPNLPPLQTSKSEVARAETGHHVAPPPPPRRIYTHHPPIEYDSEFKPTCGLRPPPRNTTTAFQRRASLVRKGSNRSRRRSSLASNRAMGMISQAVNRSASKQFSPRNIPSPTLSEAENDLEAHLTSFTDDNPFKWDDIVTKDSPLSPQGLPRQDSVTYHLPIYTPPPELPRKSSKRMSQAGPNGFRLSRVPGDHIASQMKRNHSSRKSKRLTITIPETKRMTTDDFVLSPIPIPPKDIKRTITPEVAENVILGILWNLESLDDLFATAVVNRGFYRVYKRHELDLMKAALRKTSPPAWEYREICYPGHDEPDADDRPRREYTPETYLRHYTHDMLAIDQIKSLIKDNCQSFVRPEISAALVSSDATESARVDDALWRIWTFCKIFGSGKGREEDIVAQMDWLKGGVLVHQKTCTFSVLTCDDLNETLASAPECFAKGNEDGLTAEQLFDMMELWNCLGVLLQPIGGRTIQAREYGVYENTDIRGGDIDGEEMMLDEWYYYLLTLGLSTILDLSGPCHQAEPSAAFVFASENGWIDWSPPIFGGTRRNFLKEAASRVYEDKIAVTYAESSTKEVQRQLSKQRIQRHISELRHRKNSGERLQEVRMSQERPISEWEGVIHNLTRPRPPLPQTNNLVTHIPVLRSSPLAHDLSIAVPELPSARTPPPPAAPRSPARRIVAQPLLPTPPPSTVPSTRDRSSLATSMGMPAIEEHPAFRNRRQESPIPEMPSLDQHPAFAQHLRQMSGGSNRAPSTPGSSHSDHSHPAFQQHPLQRVVYGGEGDLAEHTADKAVYRIVEMGFTPEQARQALRRTDLGDGLRVDRAVELLLREMAM